MRTGQPLGPLDGVIVGIKEEMHARGLPTRLGTRWLPNIPSSTDCARGGAAARGRSHRELSDTDDRVRLVPPGREHVSGHASQSRTTRHTWRGGSSTGFGRQRRPGSFPAGPGLRRWRLDPRARSFLRSFWAEAEPRTDSHDWPRDGVAQQCDRCWTAGVSAYDLAVFTEVAAGSDPGDPDEFGPAAPRSR